MPTIPPEIITDILIRLPVESLLRLRCVSKPWCSQIDDPALSKLHLNHSSQTNSRRSLILPNPVLGMVLSLSLDLDSLDQLYIREDPPASQGLVVGTCNGLLCMYKSVEEIFFWNPATRKHLKLPLMPVTSSKGFDPSSFDFHSMAYGFGYDSLHDDYKLMTIDRFCNTCVYSMKSNLWKRTLGFPIPVAGEQSVGVFVSGALHWMSRVEDNSCVILAVDLGSQYYSPELLRPPVDVNQGMDFNLGALNGSLSVCLHYFQEPRVDVWVMKEYGVQESWTKLFSTDVFVDMKMRTLAYSDTENEVILEGGPNKLLRYDLEKKRMHKLQVPGCGWMNKSEARTLVESTFEAHDFVESLVKPMTMPCGDAGTTGKAANRRNINKRDGFLSKGFKLVL